MISNISTLNYEELQYIYENKERLNYKQLCKRLNIKECAGNSKVKQLRELTGICKFERDGQKYIITEIYEHPLKLRDGRWIDDRNDLFNVPIENRHSSGIYIIKLNNIVYVGQTCNFYNRFTQHYTNLNGNSKKTQNLLKQGAIFSIIELEDNLDKRLLKEKEYILKYSNDNNYVCINCKNTTKNNKTIKKNKKFSLKFRYEDKKKVIELLNKGGIKYEGHKI